jgi:hypothetical protein
MTRILQKPEGLGELLPDRLLTLSPCLTQFLPDSWAFDWASFADSERVAALAKLGLTAELLPLIRRSVDAAFAAGELGWPNVWQSVRAAQALLATPGIADRDFLLVELGIPEDFVATLLADLAPAPGEGDSGLYARLKTASPVHQSGVPLGWELLGVETGGACHSWLCNSIQDDAARSLGIRPGSLGLLPSEEDARAVHSLIANGLGVEPVPWFPGRLSQIADAHP